MASKGRRGLDYSCGLRRFNKFSMRSFFCKIRLFWLNYSSALLLFFLQLITSVTLLSRGWLTYRFNHPFRDVLWSEQLMSPILGWFKVTWEHHHAHSDGWITTGINGIGIFLMFSALLPFFTYLPRCKGLIFLLIPAFLLLFLDSAARYFSSNWQFGMLIEHALQVISPLFLILWFCIIKKRNNKRKKGKKGISIKKQNLFYFTLALAAACTFLGHGLYAYGYYPVPLQYQLMTMQLLQCEQEFALSFLKIAGILDFCVAIGIFIRWKKICFYSLFYMVFWGGVTALARVLTLYNPAQEYNGLEAGLGETLVRTAHWALPLWMIFVFLPLLKNLRSS